MTGRYLVTLRGYLSSLLYRLSEVETVRSGSMCTTPGGTSHPTDGFSRLEVVGATHAVFSILAIIGPF